MHYYLMISGLYKLIHIFAFILKNNNDDDAGKIVPNAYKKQFTPTL